MTTMMIYLTISKPNYEKIEILLNYLISTKTQNYTIIVIIILYSRRNTILQSHLLIFIQNNPLLNAVRVWPYIDNNEHTRIITDGFADPTKRVKRNTIWVSEPFRNNICSDAVL